MKSWHINAVRVPLNESCWPGIDRIEQSLGGPAYQAAARGYVDRLQSAGIYVIFDLHRAAPGSRQATGIIPIPDAEHALEFWKSVATSYRNDHGVLFDLYNEPHDVGWPCWESGCVVNHRRVGLYPAVGMDELVEVVRSTGALQPLMLGGLDYARNLDGWLACASPA